MAPKARWIVLLGLLAVSTALVAIGDKPAGPEIAGRVEDPSGAPVPEERHSRQGDTNRGGQPEEAMVREIRPRAATLEMAKAFAVRDWTPPPPPHPAGAAKPMVPPLPFTFLGKQFGDERWLVFLGARDRTYIVKENDAIDGVYRVDSIRPPTMTLTYLPLQQQQILAIGDTP